MAQEWTYRWLGACLAELTAARDSADLENTFASAAEAAARTLPAPVRRPEFDPKVVRAWAVDVGWAVSDRGRIPTPVLDAYRAAQRAES